MKRIYHIFLILAVAGTLVSCFNKEKPNYHFMPDMYYSVAYEAYGEYEIFRNGQSAMLPAEGTIPRGWAPYEYENTLEDFARARTDLKNPLPVTEANLVKGKELYGYYCSVCHGDNGDGQGILVQREKFLGVPSYADPGRTLTEGSIYHVQMYGLNAMGSFQQQTSEQDRWQITMHILNLKAELEGTPKLPLASDAATAEDTSSEDATLSEAEDSVENIVEEITIIEE